MPNTAGATGQARWSSDGTRLGFERAGSILIGPADGSGFTDVTTGRVPTGCTTRLGDFSPDDKTISLSFAYIPASGCPTGVQLLPLNPADGNLTQLTTGTQDHPTSWIR